MGQSASTLDGAFSGSVDGQWRTWEQIPVGVRVVLEHHGCAPSEPFVTAASAPRTRRRGSDVFQRASAWAVDRSRLLLLDAVRGLEPVDQGRFRPNTAWRVTVRLRPFTGQVKKRAGSVPVDAVPATSSAAEAPDTTLDPPDVIDVLPAPVRRQVVTTVPEPEIEDDYLFQGVLDGFPRDHEAGLLRATSQTMIAVLATRSILVARHRSPREAELALASAAWKIQTVTAQLGAQQVVDIVEYTEDEAIAGNRPPPPLGAAPDRHGVGE